MGKKKSASETKAVPEKPVPAMFLPSLSVVYDPDRPDLYHAEMKATEAVIGRRSDLEGRLEFYTPLLRAIVLPYYGDRPDLPLMELPACAPQEARDAFDALHSITLIQDALRSDQAGASQVMRLALCWAIDLGQMLQRFAVQNHYGSIVALGVANADSLSNGRKVVQERKLREVERLTAEYNRRKILMGNASRVKNAIFSNMANDLDPNGKVHKKTKKRASKWGSLSKLKRLIGHLE